MPDRTPATVQPWMGRGGREEGEDAYQAEPSESNDETEVGGARTLAKLNIPPASAWPSAGAPLHSPSLATLVRSNTLDSSVLAKPGYQPSHALLEPG